MQREERRRERRRAVLMWAVAAVVLAGLAGGVSVAIVQSRQRQTEPGAVQSFTNLSRNHVQTAVPYPQRPPAGGDHAPVWLNCGTYTTAVPDTLAVHSLEHGAVWITYRPDLARGQISQIQDLTNQPYLLTSPYDGLPAPVVATAWGKQLKLTTPDDVRLKAFISSYRQGPQTPEPGAACTGGTDAGIPRANL